MEDAEHTDPAPAGITDTHSEAASPPAKRSSLEASILERTKRKLVAVDPEQCTPSPYSIRHPDELTEVALKPMMDSILAIGQMIPVRGRMPDGSIEVFGSMPDAPVSARYFVEEIGDVDGALATTRSLGTKATPTQPPSDAGS